jgi:hypothetical protein
MKIKSLPFLFLAIFLFSNLHAQITTDNVISYFNPSPYYIYGVKEAPVASVVPGASGAQVTWDFTGLVEDYLDSIRYLQNSIMPEPQLFPNAVYGSLSSHAFQHIYFQMYSDSIDILGGIQDIGWGQPTIFRNTPARRLVESQTTYGSTRMIEFVSEALDTNRGAFPANYDSLYFKDAVQQFDTIDAFGSAQFLLRMGGNAFWEACLRNKVLEIHADSTFGKDTILGWQLISSNSYSQLRYEWISNNGYMSEAIMERNNPDSVATFRFLYFGYLLNAEAQNNAEIDFKCIPNPIVSGGKIEFTLEKQYDKLKLELYNVTGQKVLEIANPFPFVSGKHTLAWPESISTLGNGTYFLALKSENNTLKTIKVLIQR